MSAPVFDVTVSWGPKGTIWGNPGVIYSGVKLLEYSVYSVKDTPAIAWASRRQRAHPTASDLDKYPDYYGHPYTDKLRSHPRERSAGSESPSSGVTVPP
ncbi:hypothetical protein AB0O75_31665 [Streptomyces sp. NPDC088921]|uniref:hypothetical protein n=1 Tax=unclassified Streptomyces TaxID=2593676 RepID=UPI00341F4173